jgi:O-antigen ligase
VALVAAVVGPVRAQVADLWRSSSRITTLEGDPSVADHLDLWSVAIEIVEHHPLVGTGPETFPDQFARYAPAVLPAAAVRHFEQYRVESPHNQLLALASSAGVPAAAAYLAVLIGCGRTLLRPADRSSDPSRRVVTVAVAAAGVGHLVTGSFMSAEITGSWTSWTVAGAGLAIATIPPGAGVAPSSVSNAPDEVRAGCGPARRAHPPRARQRRRTG